MHRARKIGRGARLGTDVPDEAVWIASMNAAITGLLARGSQMEPEVVAHLAAKIADHALGEYQAKTPLEDVPTFQEDPK
jgi:hypothetical protein